MSCTSPSPKIPAGRRAQVRSLEGERFAERTEDSASAWGFLLVGVFDTFGFAH